MKYSQELKTWRRRKTLVLHATFNVNGIWIPSSSIMVVVGPENSNEIQHTVHSSTPLKPILSHLLPHPISCHIPSSQHYFPKIYCHLLLSRFPSESIIRSNSSPPSQSTSFHYRLTAQCDLHTVQVPCYTIYYITLYRPLHSAYIHC
jgi:hypothetical protein